MKSLHKKNWTIKRIPPIVVSRFQNDIFDQSCGSFCQSVAYECAVLKVLGSSTNLTINFVSITLNQYVSLSSCSNRRNKVNRVYHLKIKYICCGWNLLESNTKTESHLQSEDERTSNYLNRFPGRQNRKEKTNRLISLGRDLFCGFDWSEAGVQSLPVKQWAHKKHG